MKTRAPEAADKPYPELQVHLKSHQNLFAARSVKGACVGFFVPAYLAGVNVPGYHFHFLSDDKQFGGHVIDFVAESVVVELDEAAGISVEVIDSADFQSADLAKDRAQATSTVERGK